MAAILVIIVAVSGALLLTWLLRGVALRHDLLDRPNERSSHATPVPRAGGLAIVTVVSIAALLLWGHGALPLAQMLAWVGAGVLLASVGFIDDRHGLGVAPRLLAHTLAALAAVWALLASGALAPSPSWGALALLVVGLVWSVNLFNFMDGIDALAAQQALFVAGAAVLLAGGPGANADLWLLLVLAAASAGFLLLNLPPARIFLGDSGSGYLGFALGLGALLSYAHTPLTPWTWLILHALFILDATLTVLRRVLRGENVAAAHREHAYQHLVRRWRSHARVSAAFFAVNVLWLLPLAHLSVRYPSSGAALTALAWAPLGLAGLASGSGTKERQPR